MVKRAQLDVKALQEKYGSMASLINSYPDLKALFTRAVSGGWTADRFQVELRETKWYKQHGESWRNAMTQAKVDPGTYTARVLQVRTNISMMAGELGVNMGQSTLNALANEAYQLGMDENQIRQRLSTYVTYTQGHMLGKAGEYETQLRQYMQNMGIDVSNDTIKNYVKTVIGGTSSIESAMNTLRETAISAFPNLAERLRAGETVADIASPYMEAMATNLEIPPAAINLKDPQIRGALSGPAGADGKPTLKPLYEFEKEIRKDPRWLKTNNARNSLTTVTEGVLKDMGLVS